MNYFFHPAARAEHFEHVVYYESRQPGLGARYLAAFDAAMDKICTAPLRHKLVSQPNIRRYRMPGFPYDVLYRHVDDEVEVLVVAPHRRRPDYWIGRL